MSIDRAHHLLSTHDNFINNMIKVWQYTWTVLSMVGSGDCTKQRRQRRKQIEASSIAQPNKPKAKRGPKKKSKRKFNFQPKVPTTNAIANNQSVVTRARNAIATASVVVASHNRTSSAISHHRWDCCQASASFSIAPCIYSFDRLYQRSIEQNQK